MTKLGDSWLGLGLLILSWMFSLMTISLSFKLHKNLSCLRVSRTLLKKDDTLLEFRRTCCRWFHTGAGVHDHKNLLCSKVSTSLLEDMVVPDWGWGPWSRFWCVSLMTISLSFKFHKNLSHDRRCQEASSRMMTLCWSLGGHGGSWLRLGSLITIWMCSFDDNKLKFQV